MDSGRLEAVPPGTVHLDTVRALHQTVVSLRTALEVSKNELKELKQKYEEHSHCLEYADVIEKLSLENHILRRKIIDKDFEDREPRTPNIKLQVTYSPRQNVEDYSEVVINTATTELDSTIESVEPETQKDIRFCSTEQLNKIEEQLESAEEKLCEEYSQGDNVELSSNKEDLEISSGSDIKESEAEDPRSQIASFARRESEDSQPTSFKTKLELLSKFDVRIKVRTLKEGTIISSTTSDSDSTTEDKRDKDKESKETTGRFQFQERREHFESKEDQKGNWINLKSVSSENIKMAVPNEADAKTKVDKFDVQVRITSEENLVVKEHLERSRRKDTLNLDVDDLSLRSLSEGDNSVFSEGVTTPLDPQGPPTEDKLDQDNASGNESEEVDDIELIFTTDESKDMSNLQEDLVSIRESGDTETEQWAPSSTSTHSTPVLIKFHTLDPDFQPRGETADNAENENQENSSLQGVLADSSLRIKRVSLPSDKDIRHVAFNGKSLDLPGRGILKSCDNKSDNMLYRKSPNASTRRLDSVDSLTCEYNRGLSFDNTKSSSFELGSSMDILHREESMDSFHRNANLGHRFSVFAETDISKCGISEDDLAANLNIRRNTCPNPFQYRPAPPRYVSRAPGPFKAGSRRPVLRDATTPRRDSGAQTDVTALPPRWSSDGHLAYKMSLPVVAPSQPPRGAGAGRRPPPPDARPPPPARRSDETRRVLLSDIGFTSMVPELSRSADPVWALARLPPTSDASPVSTSTSKFLSRGSSYRSPCVSIDRSNDWIPQNVFVPNKADSRAWRSSLPDVRRDDTDELLEEAENYLRRSIDNLRSTSLESERPLGQPAALGQPYIPSEPRQLRLGHTVKVITPHARVAVGRVRYVGIAGGSAASCGVVVGAEFPLAAHPALPRNDGTHRQRRYFLTAPHHTALFVPFNKVVMAWAN
ncbi:uncharacterized protein LOC126373908 [Pectinophora gossypiella]|uniref:uncharacterized protein LOC126373908 n=1 Tax=Pectinophora gossypiella TaxID=13191 RepID=UPI00214F1805|nr:uncharacterized protein LOC126373908 [Pectinophora gossypiella]